MNKKFDSIAEVVEFIESFDGAGIIAANTELLIEEVKQRAEFEDLPDGDLQSILNGEL